MTGETPLEDRITQAIADLASSATPQKGNPAYLSRNEISAGFRNYLQNHRRIAKRLKDKSGGGLGIYISIEEDRATHRLALEYLRAGDYKMAYECLPVQTGSESMNLRMEIWGLSHYSTGTVSGDVQSWEVAQNMARHYVQTHMVCKILSGAKDCDEMIEKVKVSAKRKTDPFLIAVEGSCENSEHSFTGEFTAHAYRIIDYKPISVLGERPG